MKKRSPIVILAVALVVVVIVAGLIYNSLSGGGSAPSQARVSVRQDAANIAAPDFTMLDARGESVALSDYFGTPIVLNFWASWCGPCKREMPEFDAAAADTDGEVYFMMVNLTDGRRETVSSATRFIENEGYSFPLFFDTQAEGAVAYSVRSIPATYFIDAEGKIQAYYVGSMSSETLSQGIAVITE